MAGLSNQQRPKSGVFAVRQGPVLARNLRALVLSPDAALQPYKAQSRFLSLLNCADGTAIASYGSLAARGVFLWRLKDWIDRRFMHRFQAMPDMNPDKPPPADELVDAEVVGDMRCGGCGSKLNATLLAKVLRDLPQPKFPHVVQGVGDDAAVLAVNDRAQALTTDGFRSMVDDPYQFGRIGVQHALGDLYAMGAQPSAALLNVTIPLMREVMMEDELRQVMEGVSAALTEADLPLVGGHSSEGAELSLAVTVVGDVQTAEDELLLKTAGQVGDVIVLTKALGTGTLLASAMRGMCAGADYAACLAAMEHSNRAAIDVLLAHNVHATTDVTGFGLLGHLLEMLANSDLAAQLSLQNIPVLPGALDAARAGYLSSLHAANQRVLSAVDANPNVQLSGRWPLLVDPQTAGGLLATLPAAQAENCIAALRETGYEDAAIIGQLAKRPISGTDALEPAAITIDA